MKWFALFWVYRRETLLGWRRGWRKPQVQIQTVEEMRAQLDLSPIVPDYIVPDAIIPSGWITRPIEVPPFSESAVKRLYGSSG